jgi:hypothetical protein
MSPGEACPVCGQGQARRLGEKHDYAVLECGRCAALFVPNGSVGSALPGVYEHYYDRATFEAPPTVEASLERLVRSSERFRKTGLWLDVGYGEGALLAIAERHRWACFGTEVVARALEHGRRRGWTVTADPSSDRRFEPGRFDVVTMIELLEHVADPGGFLRQAAQWLRPGGLLYVTTPNGRSLNRRILGLDWSVVAPPEHVVLWSVRALRHGLVATGFKILRLRSEGCNPAEILARLRGNGAGTPTVDRNQSALALSAAMARSPLRRVMKIAVNEALNSLSIGDTLKAWAVRA